MIIPLGGGGSKVVASIVVIYPAGSTCTCTLGSKVLTAKDTSGKWVFGLPSTGNWVVKATKGSQNTSKTISITAEGQVETVELAYDVLLFKSGEGSTVEFKTAHESNSSVMITSDAITTNFTSDINYQITCITPQIDLTEFSRLSVIANCTAVGPSTDYQGILGVFAKTATATNLVSAKNSDAKVIAKTYFTVKNGEFDLDITNINGEYKIGIKGGLKSTISEIRLRR